MSNHTQHVAVLRTMRNRASGEEKAAIRHILNRVELLETKLKTINRLSFIKRDEQGEAQDDD